MNNFSIADLLPPPPQEKKKKEIKTHNQLSYCLHSQIVQNKIKSARD